MPVYLGDPLVKNDFNSKAFIDCNDFPNLDEVVKKVIEIDNDVEQYMYMLKDPVFEDGYIEQKQEELEKFLINIFDQEKEKAYRRPKGPSGGCDGS